MLFYFTQLKPDRKYQGLLAQITSLESEKAVAESKIDQLQLVMSNEAAEVEKAHKERDDLKVEVSRLQLEVKGPKTKLARKNIKTLHVFRNGIRHRPCGLFEVLCQLEDVTECDENSAGFYEVF